MDSAEAQRVLDSSEELQITIAGRRSGREISAPVWFVREGKTIYLLPLTGSKTQWFRNMLKSKRVKISSGRFSLDLAAKPITEARIVASVTDKFRQKHGAADVKKYYTVLDVAVELNLP